MLREVIKTLIHLDEHANTPMPTNGGVAAIINPSAGRGRAARLWREWLPQLRERLGDITVYETTAPREATSLAAHALHKGHDRVISAGGDGTHFEVTNGYFEGDAPINPDASIAFLPLGSGADFTKTLKMPKSQAEILETLARWDARSIDVARISVQSQGGEHTYYFQNIARVGAGAEVVSRAEKIGKRYGGFTSFLIATVQTVIKLRAKPIRIEADDRIIEQDFLELVIANGIHDGGGMKTAPNARLDNGLLEVYFYGPVAAWDALLNLRRIYNGTMMGRPDVVQYFQSTTLRVTSKAHVLVEADGEVLGSLPAEVKLLPGVLRAVVGAGFDH